MNIACSTGTPKFELHLEAYDSYDAWKKPNAKPVCMRGNYKNSYIAPELIDGTCKPSVKTDIFAFCFMIKSVYRLLKFNFPPIVGDTLIQPPQSRPSIEKLKECLTE